MGKQNNGTRSAQITRQTGETKVELHGLHPPSDGAADFRSRMVELRGATGQCRMTRSARSERRPQARIPTRDHRRPRPALPDGIRLDCECDERHQQADPDRLLP